VTSPTKNSYPQVPNFFKSKLEDFPHLYRVWTALELYRSASSDRTKSLAL